MDITTILIIINIGISALAPIIKMIGRIKHSKCMGAEFDVSTSTDEDIKK